MLDQFAILIAIVIYAINIGCIFIELVKAQFKAYILKYQQAGCHANRKAGNIDERKSFVLPQISPCGFEIVFDHK
jgi:hypothetical protein